MSKFENLETKGPTSLPLVPITALTTTTAVTSSSTQLHAQNYVIYVHPMENCALLLPQILNCYTKIGIEKQTEKEQGERKNNKKEKRTQTKEGR